jgi:hypothetical protein
LARLRREAHARMLGNGLCTRPVDLDCRMESAFVFLLGLSDGALRRSHPRVDADGVDQDA